MSTYSSVSDARILVIDDEIANITLLEKMLHRAGYSNIKATTDSRQAIELVETFEPDVVLLDLHMPHLDGFAVMEAIQQHVPETTFLPVLVLTADATDETRERALSHGAHDFLTKPFEYNETTLRLRNLLRTRRLHLQLEQHNAVLRSRLDDHEAAGRAAAERLRELSTMIERAIHGEGLTMVFQPIVNLATGAIEGVEALARFAAKPLRPPNEWFADAAEVGLGEELELAAIRAALAHAHLLPAGVSMALNVSPSTLQSAELAEVVAASVTPIVLELTEHERIDDYEPLLAAMDRLRPHGARLAVDDAGAGFASLQHILKLQPDILKLDRFLIAGADQDPSRRALIAALVTFCVDTHASLVAEGLETVDELAVVCDLGVQLGQGYLLARPGPLPVAPLAPIWPS